MPNLDELQDRMGADQDRDAADAGKILAGYYYVYNEEYNALLITMHEVEVALFDAQHKPGGGDIAAVLLLQSMALGLKARMIRLDQKMLAFHANQLSIEAPGEALLADVKRLSGELAQMQVKADAVNAITAKFTALAALLASVHGA